jgi:hypothetical protein
VQTCFYYPRLLKVVIALTQLINKEEEEEEEGV